MVYITEYNDCFRIILSDRDLMQELSFDKLDYYYDDNPGSPGPIEIRSNRTHEVIFSSPKGLTVINRSNKNDDYTQYI